jgi:hypothetical protein
VCDDCLTFVHCYSSFSFQHFASGNDCHEKIVDKSNGIMRFRWHNDGAGYLICGDFASRGNKWQSYDSSLIVICVKKSEAIWMNDRESLNGV